MAEKKTVPMNPDFFDNDIGEDLDMSDEALFADLAADGLKPEEVFGEKSLEARKEYADWLIKNKIDLKRD